MVFNALQINSYVFSEECKMEKYLFGRRKVASAECELSVDHITITLAIQWPSGCGHATFGFRRAPATAWTWWCVLANKGFTNLAIVTKFSPLPEPCDYGKTTTCGSVNRAKSVNGEVHGSGARKLFERIVPTKRHAETDTIDHAGRWLDQRVAILADQPLCSDELDDQLSSLLCRLIR